jgi:hypothetical protein
MNVFVVYLQVASGQGISMQQFQNKLAQLHGPELERQHLCNISAWLIINQMRSEKVQFNLLSEQSVSNVWRKRAYGALVTSIGATEGKTVVSADIAKCVNVFRDRLDYTVENTVPVAVPFREKLQKMIETHRPFLGVSWRVCIDICTYFSMGLTLTTFNNRIRAISPLCNGFSR